MDYLMITEPDDAHAIVVQHALESMGHGVELLFTADQPTKQINSLFITNNQTYQKISDSSKTMIHDSYDVVWWRRPRDPYLTREHVDADDYYFVRRENKLFHDVITDDIAPNAWWVNSKDAAIKATNKSRQLKIAAQCGMTIPKTLFSNNPQDIREFVNAHDVDGVIYKPLCANFWFEESEMKITYTRPVHTLPSDHVLQMSPGIYQKTIHKAYELRVTCFGDYCVAAKLNSQEQSAGQYDWRRLSGSGMKIEPYLLPEQLQKQIQEFMRSMGLVFGSLDFIVTKDHEYVFLEVNEQGQFLWIEESNPDIHLLDPMIQFMVHRTRDFVWDKAQIKHRLMDYAPKVIPCIEELTQKHVDLNSAKAYMALQQQV